MFVFRREDSRAAMAAAFCSAVGYGERAVVGNLSLLCVSRLVCRSDASVFSRGAAAGNDKKWALRPRARLKLERWLYAGGGSNRSSAWPLTDVEADGIMSAGVVRTLLSHERGATSLDQNKRVACDKIIGTHESWSILGVDG